MNTRKGGAWWLWRTRCWVTLRMASGGVESQALLVRSGAAWGGPGEVQGTGAWCSVSAPWADGRQHSVGQFMFSRKKKWLQDLGLSKLPDSLLPEGRLACFGVVGGLLSLRASFRTKEFLGRRSLQENQAEVLDLQNSPQGPRAGLLCLGLCAALPEMRGPFIS